MTTESCVIGLRHQLLATIRIVREGAAQIELCAIHLPPLIILDLSSSETTSQLKMQLKTQMRIPEVTIRQKSRSGSRSLPKQNN